jgi:hypothetical protein
MIWLKIIYISLALKIDNDAACDAGTDVCKGDLTCISDTCR